MLTLASNAALGVSASTAGSVIVAADRLRRVLGLRAWHVWQVLCAHRDRDGYTHITVRGIARARGFVAINHRTVEDALRRLEAAGLVQRIDWMPREVQRGARTIKRSVYIRRVLGALLPDDGCGSRAAIPEVTKNWGSTAAVWGGRRAGAGRRKRGEGMAEKNQVPGGVSNSSTGTDKREESKRVSITSEESLLPSEAKPAARASRAGDASSFLMGERTSPVTLLATPAPGLPPYPGVSVIECARIPDPPKLREEDGPEVWAVLLATLFKNAVEKRYGVREFQFRNEATIRRSKHFNKLQLFAEKLFAHDIPPGAWVAFRVDEWKANTKERRSGAPETPTVGYVFSMRAVTDMRWRFREAMGDGDIGGRALYGKSHRELLRRYTKMHAAINAGMRKAEARERAFPGDLWDVLLDAARAESAELRRNLSMQVKRGDFLW